MNALDNETFNVIQKKYNLPPWSQSLDVVTKLINNINNGWLKKPKTIAGLLISRQLLKYNLSSIQDAKVWHSKALEFLREKRKQDDRKEERKNKRKQKIQDKQKERLRARTNIKNQDPETVSQSNLE